MLDLRSKSKGPADLRPRLRLTAFQAPLVDLQALVEDHEEFASGRDDPAQSCIASPPYRLTKRPLAEAKTA